MNYVYTLRCPITNDVFYVGEGAKYRAWSHTKPGSIMPYDVNYPSHFGYIKKLYILAQEPIVEIVFRGTKKECQKVEMDLISKYNTIWDGGILLQRKGKNGLVGFKKPWSAHAKESYKEKCKDQRKYKFEPDVLREEYVVLGMTRKQIAEKYGCSEVLVKQRLKEFSITKRRGIK
jgi:hypothetical protein